jgi:hypothetical protein
MVDMAEQHPDTEPPMVSGISPTTSDIEKSFVHEEEAPKDPNIVDFDKPTDPENPMDWPSSKKTTAIALVTMMTILSYVPLSCQCISADPF